MTLGVAVILVLTVMLKRRRVQRTRQIYDAFMVRHGLMVSSTEGSSEFARLASLR